MPSKPRSDMIDPTERGTYHIWTRCVRRAFLCGEDRYSGKNYEHRRDWIEQRVRELARWFAIDVLFVSWMANHFHLVLHNLPELVDQWSDQEVIERSCRIFPYKFRRMGVKPGGPAPKQLQGLAGNKKLVATLRARLCDPSWFMRQLNQYIARRANGEDECTGKFFESRFGARRVVDEMGLLVCGVYVDLNQIAAGEAETPETSTRTSAYLRIQGQAARQAGSAAASDWDGFLAPIGTDGDGQNYQPGSGRASDRGLLDIRLEDYLELLDWTGRQLRRGKRGRIDPQLPPILKRLELGLAGGGQAEVSHNGELFCTMIEQFETFFRDAVGSVQSLIDHAAKLGERAARRCRKRFDLAPPDD